MKNKKIVQKAGSRFLAMMLSVAMVVPEQHLYRQNIPVRLKRLQLRLTLQKTLKAVNRRDMSEAQVL